MHFESDYLQNVIFDGTLSSSGQLTVKQNLAGAGTGDLCTLRRQ